MSWIWTGNLDENHCIPYLPFPSTSVHLILVNSSCFWPTIWCLQGFFLVVHPSKVLSFLLMKFLILGAAGQSKHILPCPQQPEVLLILFKSSSTCLSHKIISCHLSSITSPDSPYSFHTFLLSHDASLTPLSLAQFISTFQFSSPTAFLHSSTPLPYSSFAFWSLWLFHFPSMQSKWESLLPFDHTLHSLNFCKSKRIERGSVNVPSGDIYGRTKSLGCCLETFSMYNENKGDQMQQNCLSRYTRVFQMSFILC